MLCSSTYATLKTVTSGGDGSQRTTTKSRTDGYVRLVFTGPATTAGGFVDIG